MALEPYIENGSQNLRLDRGELISRSQELDTQTVTFQNESAALYKVRSTIADYPGLPIVERRCKPDGPVYLYDLTLEGLADPEEWWRETSYEERQPEEGWDEALRTVVTKNPDHEWFAKGSQLVSTLTGLVLPGCENLYIADRAARKHRAAGYWTVQMLCKGLKGTKPYKRRINGQVITTSTKFDGDKAILSTVYQGYPPTSSGGTIGIAGANLEIEWDSAEITLSDTYISTTAPPTSFIGRPWAPPDAPIVNYIDLDDATYENNKRLWPFNWVCTGMPCEQLPGTNLWLVTANFVNRRSVPAITADGMNKFWQAKKVYTGLRTTSGLALMEDVWRFARWVGELLHQTLTVDGVEFATSSGFTANSESYSLAVPFKPAAGAYHFRRHDGAALASDLAEYAKWLEAQLSAVTKDSGLNVQIAHGRAGHLPVPSGLLFTRKELLVFIRAVATRAGFSVQCDDIAEVRENSGSFTVRRQARPVGVARLAVEVEAKKVTAFACVYSADSIESPGNFVVVETTVDHYANGDVTSSNTASGEIEAYEPEETPAECAALVFETDYDPEFAYGAFENQEVTESLLAHADLFAAAMSAFAAASPAAATQSYEWTREQWSTISAVGGFTDDVKDPRSPASFATNGHRWEGDTPTYAEVDVTSVRWRAVNNGDCDILVTWERVAIIGGSVLATGTLELEPGAVSDWVGPPSIPSAPDADDASYYRVSRVQLNGLA